MSRPSKSAQHPRCRCRMMAQGRERRSLGKLLGLIAVSSFAAARGCSYINACSIKPVPHRDHVDGAVRVLRCNRRDVYRPSNNCLTRASEIEAIVETSLLKARHYANVSGVWNGVRTPIGTCFSQAGNFIAKNNCCKQAPRRPVTCEMPIGGLLSDRFFLSRVR